MNALITGTTSGIGKEFANLFAEKGYDLVLIDIEKDALEKQKNQIEKKYHNNVKIITKDLSKASSPDEIFNEVKKEGLEIDTLINNAGFGTSGSFVDTDWGEEKNLAAVNMLAPMRLSYLFGKEMKKRKNGHIINIASIASYTAGPYMTMYYASKAFVRSFTEGLHDELEKYGVSVTAVCPGPTDTNFEKRAKMEHSYMFKKMKVDAPKDVAKQGYQAMLKNRAVVVVNPHNKLLTFASRFCSLSTNRALARYINKGNKKF